MKQVKDKKSTDAREPKYPRRETQTLAVLFESKIENLVAYWLDSESFNFERWDLVPDTLLINRQNKTIRFGVQPVGVDPPEPFQVIIRKTDGGWFFKTDCGDEADSEYALQIFESVRSILFVYSRQDRQVYFHIETGDIL